MSSSDSLGSYEQSSLLLSTSEVLVGASGATIVSPPGLSCFVFRGAGDLVSLALKDGFDCLQVGSTGSAVNSKTQ